MVEAAVEIAGEDSQGQSRPLIGDCFEEMSEVSFLIDGKAKIKSSSVMSLVSWNVEFQITLIYIHRR